MANPLHGQSPAWLPPTVSLASAASTGPTPAPCELFLPPLSCDRASPLRIFIPFSTLLHPVSNPPSPNHFCGQPQPCSSPAFGLLSLPSIHPPYLLLLLPPPVLHPFLPLLSLRSPSLLSCPCLLPLLPPHTRWSPFTPASPYLLPSSLPGGRQAETFRRRRNLLHTSRSRRSSLRRDKLAPGPCCMAPAWRA